MPAFWQQPIGAALALTLLTAASPAAADEDASGRGEYLVRAGGCFSCHTSAGGQPLTGGRALATPFGTFYSPNITPDPDTGIGRWTDAQFLRALREGVRPDGTNYFPVFPYTSFTGITDSDAVAIKAYLFSVPPGTPRQPATRCRVPVFLARPANRLEAIVLYAGPVPADARAERRLQSGRISRYRARALRRMPHAPQFLWRHAIRSATVRDLGWPGWTARPQYHAGSGHRDRQVGKE